MVDEIILGNFVTRPESIEGGAFYIHSTPLLCFAYEVRCTKNTKFFKKIEDDMIGMDWRVVEFGCSRSFVTEYMIRTIIASPTAPL